MKGRVPGTRPFCGFFFGLVAECLRFGFLGTTLAREARNVAIIVSHLKQGGLFGACLCNSSKSSSLESPGVPEGSSLRWMRRSALSRCFCWRVCSFWRLVKLDRPRPGIPNLQSSILAIAAGALRFGQDISNSSRSPGWCTATSGVREAGARGPDSRRGRRRPHRRSAVLHHPAGKRSSVSPR